MTDNTLKNSCKVFLRLCACFLLILVLSACERSTVINPSERIDCIVEACSEKGNRFPEDKLEVEFQTFALPSVEKNCFQQTVRFKNISGQPMEVQILGFYCLDLDKYIIARGGGLQPNTLEPPVVIDNNSGWVFANTLTPLYEWESYTKQEQAEIIDLASKLYFEIILETDVYYCILDFQNQKVITTVEE